jgi:SAM-dependent methyltransferase
MVTVPTEQALFRALDLSFRVSKHSAPMKPFVRFSSETRRLFASTRAARDFFWDFDAGIQNLLLSVTRAVSTPESLAAACNQRWQDNLAALAERKRLELQELKATGRPAPLPIRPREERISERIRRGGRFLYAGCGSGAECLALASLGLDVVGIDTVPELVDVANAWARHLALPFRAICMDAMALDPGLGTFDGFLVEFYGQQPARKQALHLQESLRGALADEGRGFVSANRRKYSSYWYLMGHKYSDLMAKWLAPQSDFDYLFSESDKSEEQLSFGLYQRTHTRQSLASELGHCFEILECENESDPRYVVCVATPRHGPPAEAEHCRSAGSAETPFTDSAIGRASVEVVLDKVEAICNILEAHEKNVSEHFETKAPTKRVNPIKGVEVDYPPFVRLLEEVFSELPTGSFSP